MKKVFILLLALVALLTLAACNRTDAPESTSDSQSGSADTTESRSGTVNAEMTGGEDHELEWNSAYLEGAVRDKLNIYDRPLMLSDVYDMTKLDIANVRLSNLSALKQFPNLETLYLDSCRIEDVSALGELTSLKELSLIGNSITDISALGGLTQLTYLNLSGNSIEDITPLAGLTELTYLDLSRNDITDVSALASLTKLETLNLSRNSIEDYSAVEALDIADFTK